MRIGGPFFVPLPLAAIITETAYGILYYLDIWVGVLSGLLQFAEEDVLLMSKKNCYSMAPFCVIFLLLAVVFSGGCGGSGGVRAFFNGPPF
jgi:hypothetical protein